MSCTGTISANVPVPLIAPVVPPLEVNGMITGATKSGPAKPCRCTARASVDRRLSFRKPWDPPLSRPQGTGPTQGPSAPFF